MYSKVLGGRCIEPDDASVTEGSGGEDASIRCSCVEPWTLMGHKIIDRMFHFV